MASEGLLAPKWQMDRYGGASASLSLKEIESLLASDEAWAAFRVSLAEAHAEVMERKREEATRQERRRQQAEEAAAACPIKVGQEVRVIGSSRFPGVWWRVMEIGGSPSRPELQCCNVLASGALGSKTESITNLDRLQVREQGATDNDLPSAKELAARIGAHLRRMEAKKAALGLNLSLAGASEDRGFVSIRFISYHGQDRLCREDAASYLAWLDAGGVGTWYQALSARFVVTAPTTKEASSARRSA